MDNKLLVENRECGACTVCCVELVIEDPELVKLPGVNCKHLKRSGGCGIYQTRPATCEKWYCMWRFMPLLDDDWRPDQKGVLIKRVFDNIPAGYEGKLALNFEIIGKKSIIHDMNFIEVLAGYIVQGFPCFISYAKPRRALQMAFLNDQLLPLIESRNLEALKDRLSSALKSCIKHSTDKMIIEDGEVVTVTRT
tara:strand:+ start:233189 stop:233770 length:582 start_codon:yes stop_codon:yes gene_type:complete